MDVTRFFIIFSVTVLIHGDNKALSSDVPKTTGITYSSTTSYSSICFDRYETLQQQFCNFKIDTMNEKLSAQKNACDSTLNHLKEFFGQREQLWHEQNICNASLTQIAGRREVECFNSIDGANWTKLSSGFYYFSKPNELTNWFVAGYNCKKMGMRLASIESEFEDNAVLGYLNALNASDLDMFWMSGTDLGEEGKFVWSATAEPVSFSRFGIGQPDNAGGNENCLQYIKARSSFTWNDNECNTTTRYICELQG
ncbi:C-type lectin 37Da-like [Cloeon dipterum]|uniref:C-type lectin 37Da-like n=1 Tax=Cloeon dipterum TaxID=197152 RepID=UPI0032203840